MPWPRACRNQPGLLPNPLEFEGVKIRIIESLPYTEEFDCIAIAHSIGYHAIRVHPIFLAGYIGDANIVNTPFGHSPDSHVLDNL